MSGADILFWVCLVSFIFLLAILRSRKDAKKYNTTFARAFLLPPWMLRKAAQAAGDGLDAVVYWWDQANAFTRRHLLQSVLIIGRSGSGKSSGSVFQLLKSMVADRLITLLVLASKPEEIGVVLSIFKKAGRIDDLLIFGPRYRLRFNWLDFLRREGIDDFGIVRCIVTVIETLARVQGGQRGGDNEQFWQQQLERLLYLAVLVLRLGGEEISAPNMLRFITEAPTSKELMKDETWLKNYFNRVFKVAFGAQKNARDQHDFQMALDYWTQEFPLMDQRLRGSIMASGMGALNVLSTGIVRELLSTTTNVSPEAFDHGKSVFVDMPVGQYGASGACVLAVWKYVTQLHVLARKATENTPINVIVADECQNVVNTPDGRYLAECRSHRGCMLYCTQSIHAFYTVMHQGGEHEADALLTNFNHQLAHNVGDGKTAAYFVSLLGKRREGFVSVSNSNADDVYDQLMGEAKVSSTYSEQYTDVLQARELLAGGLRSGGREAGYKVDGIVFRGGEPFSSGDNFLAVTFDQRD